MLGRVRGQEHVGWAAWVGLRRRGLGRVGWAEAVLVGRRRLSDANGCRGLSFLEPSYS